MQCVLWPCLYTGVCCPASVSCGSCYSPHLFSLLPQGASTHTHMTTRIPTHTVIDTQSVIGTRLCSNSAYVVVCFTLQERLKTREWCAAAVAFVGVLGLGVSAEPDHLDHPDHLHPLRIVTGFLVMVGALGEHILSECPHKHTHTHTHRQTDTNTCTHGPCATLTSTCHPDNTKTRTP